MATSPIYSWPEPDNTDLVKNGALAIRTLGDAIDTTMGTMVAKTIIDAKGDLIAGTAADTANRLAVGANGETLVADSSTSTGLRYQGNYAAGKNAIINGDFRINQRSFTSTTGSDYGFDRWSMNLSGGTATYSAQTFTLGAAPVAGYEGTNFARIAVTTGNDFCRLQQQIESVRTFAGQTVTLSFWAKGTNPTTAGNLKAYFLQNFGTGGSPSSTVVGTEQTFVLTANWTRYSLTFAIPSISGKTIGTAGNDFLGLNLSQGTNASTDAWTLDLWGVQVEAGSVATAFQTATGTLQGELAACQRYFQVIAVSQAWGTWYSTTDAALMAGLPVAMRVTPTATFSTVYTNAIVEVGVTDRTPTSYSAYKTSNQAFSFLANGMTTSATIRQGAVYIGPNHLLSAEL
jgi:hypothetical protein